MNILISGSRSIKDKSIIIKELEKTIKEDDIIVTGGAYGVDEIVIEWANRNNIQTMTIRPKDKSNKIDYLFRNCIMIGMCDKIIAFWDGKSKGTKFTYDYACHYKLLGYIIEV